VLAPCKCPTCEAHREAIARVGHAIGNELPGDKEKLSQAAISRVDKRQIEAEYEDWERRGSPQIDPPQVPNDIRSTYYPPMSDSDKAHHLRRVQLGETGL
jgi:hypothetical protein